jgi:hypothetical protein
MEKSLPLDVLEARVTQRRAIGTLDAMLRDLMFVLMYETRWQ